MLFIEMETWSLDVCVWTKTTHLSLNVMQRSISIFLKWFLLAVSMNKAYHTMRWQRETKKKNMKSTEEKLHDGVLHWLNTYPTHVVIAMSVISQNGETSGKKNYKIKVKTMCGVGDNDDYTR